MVESWEGGSRSTVHANFAFDSMNKGAPLPATYRRLHTELPDQKQLSSRLSSAATRLVRAQGFSFPPFPFPLYYLRDRLSLSLVAKDRWQRGEKIAGFLGEDPGETKRFGRKLDARFGTIATGGRSKRKKVGPEEVVLHIEDEWRVAEEGPTRCKPRVPQIASPRSVVAYSPFAFVDFTPRQLLVYPRATTRISFPSFLCSSPLSYPISRRCDFDARKGKKETCVRHLYRLYISYETTIVHSLCISVSRLFLRSLEKYIFLRLDSIEAIGETG